VLFSKEVTMKKFLGVVATILVASLAAGCVTTTYPLYGTTYAGVKGSLYAKTLGESKKQGKACAHSVLGIAAFGDATIKEAAKQANISEVDSVDFEQFNILGVYGRYCTIVNGK
jgi:hypothetical protein